MGKTNVFYGRVLKERVFSMIYVLAVYNNKFVFKLYALQNCIKYYSLTFEECLGPGDLCGHN